MGEVKGSEIIALNLSKELDSTDCSMRILGDQTFKLINSNSWFLAILNEFL